MTHLPSKTMSTNLPHLIQQIATQLGATPDDTQITPIRHGTFDRNNVWRLELVGEPYLLKQHLITQPIGASAFTPFQIESKVLSVLHQAGCRVPKIVWKSEPYLLLEWCGESTLDDLAQEKPLKDLTTIRNNVVRELCHIEGAFSNYADTIAPYTFPLNLYHTMEAMLTQAQKTINYLTQLGKESTLTNQHTDIETIWAELATRLQAYQSPTLGGLDYNAKNVVIHSQTPTFIDFASVGWDWQERRLIQTLSSLGAHRQDGNFVNLLDTAAVELYANESENYRSGHSRSEFATQVDRHHLLFYLVTIYRLVRAVAQPDRAENRTLLCAWGDAKARLRQAITLLADTHLSDDPCAHQLREFIAQFRQLF